MHKSMLFNIDTIPEDQTRTKITCLLNFGKNKRELKCLFQFKLSQLSKQKSKTGSMQVLELMWCPLEMLMFDLVSASAMNIYFLQNWLWFASSLHFSVSCSLYADDLAIWSSSPLVCTVVEATQGAVF